MGAERDACTLRSSSARFIDLCGLQLADDRLFVTVCHG